MKKKRLHSPSSRLFREVYLNLDTLSSTLQENEHKRKEFEQLRQDWAAGVTHDLKTPLSYISGYTDMLLSEVHDWSAAEKKEFLQLIRRVVAEAANLPVVKDNTFEILGEEEPHYVIGDTGLLKRAFSNLLINAVVHNPAGTAITVRIDSNTHIEVQITDNGNGMDEQSVNHLFDRYYLHYNPFTA